MLRFLTIFLAAFIVSTSASYADIKFWLQSSGGSVYLFGRNMDVVPSITCNVKWSFNYGVGGNNFYQEGSKTANVLWNSNVIIGQVHSGGFVNVKNENVTWGC